MREEHDKELGEQLMDIIDSIVEKYNKVTDLNKEKDKSAEIPQLLNEVDNAQLKFNQLVEHVKRDIPNQEELKEKLLNLRDIHKKVIAELTINYDEIKLEVEKINKIKANKNPYSKEQFVNPAFFDNHS